MAKAKTDTAPPVVTPMLVPATLRGAQIFNTATFLTTIGAITNGSFKIAINGVVQDTTPTNFATATTMALAAAAITTALGGSTVATCTWSATALNFTITTTLTGAAATISYASAPTTGADISTLCMLTQLSGAALSQGSSRPMGVGVLRVQKQRYRDWIAAGGTPPIYT